MDNPGRALSQRKRNGRTGPHQYFQSELVSPLSEPDGQDARNFAALGFIAILLPAARVICCTRNLRDVGASIFAQGFLGYHPYAYGLADLRWYIAQHQRLLTHSRSSLTLPMLEVDHSDWINQFDATLAHVLDFLELPTDSAYTRFYQQDRAVHTASRSQVNAPINRRGVDRWQAYKAGLRPMLRELPG